jgi:tartrate-resistant acid phosphatase type 5
MVRSSFFLLFLLVSFINVEAQTPLVKDLGYKGGSIPGIKKIDNAIHFLVIGDWGRNGENYQKEVARAMGRAGHDLDIDFIITTGDNFYPIGVASTRDYHWISSFETIYTAQSLYRRWYPVLGNHDYGANPDAVVEYSKVSSRWAMPSRYYSQTFMNGRDTILIAFLDTDPIVKEMDGDPYDSVKYVKGGVARQRQWLEDLLASSNARWKIVVGHHPMYTGGWRKNSVDTKNIKSFLGPIFEKNNVDVYIAGHEHHLEYTKPAGKTHHIISGSGSEARPVSLHPDGGKFAAAVQGFASFSVVSDSILVQFIDHKDKIINTTVIKK